MDTLLFVRLFFVVICGVVGYYVGDILGKPMLGAQIGCVSSVALIIIEMRLRRVSVSGLSSMVFGLLLGFLMAKLVANIIRLLPLDSFIFSVIEITLTLIFSYLGAVIALRGKDEFNIIIPYVRLKRQSVSDDPILVDTSAIVDGRIADIYLTKFLIGRLIVARSVLKELHQLADSQDEIRRQRGRRGLDVLRNMQNDTRFEIHIHEDNLEQHDKVDDKLMTLAKIMDARICTTDFNMGRIAALQGIDVININDLAKAVKPHVFVGDSFHLRLVKEGTDNHQAVGYLEDGTMVVVSHAREAIGREVSVKVQSVIQTQGGKMIFCELEK